MVPAAPYWAGICRPGGRLPATIEKVSTEPSLVRMNASYGSPILAPGSTQTPLTRVAPLSPGEHSRTSFGGSLTVMAKVSCAVCRLGLTTRTVNVNVPSWVGVPMRIPPCVPLGRREMPGGRLPAVTVKVSVVLSLVTMNASYRSPRVAAGKTQTPLVTVQFEPESDSGGGPGLLAADAGAAMASPARNSPAAAATTASGFRTCMTSSGRQRGLPTVLGDVVRAPAAVGGRAAHDLT